MNHCSQVHVPSPAGASRFGAGGHEVFMGCTGAGSAGEASGPTGKEGGPSAVSSGPVGSCQHVCGVHGAASFSEKIKLEALLRDLLLCVFLEAANINHKYLM